MPLSSFCRPSQNNSTNNCSAGAVVKSESVGDNVQIPVAAQTRTVYSNRNHNQTSNKTIPTSGHSSNYYKPTRSFRQEFIIGHETPMGIEASLIPPYATEVCDL